MYALKDLKDGNTGPTDPTYTGRDICRRGTWRPASAAASKLREKGAGPVSRGERVRMRRPMNRNKTNVDRPLRGHSGAQCSWIIRAVLVPQAFRPAIVTAAWPMRVAE
jgi:hypothetical protein